MLDVAVIGVGLAGISAAVECQKKGLKIGLFDKSRGVGGRLATRRVNDIRLDHGLPSWNIQGPHTQALTEKLLAEQIISPWKVAHSDSNSVDAWQTLETENFYAAPNGMTAIAKYLARDLTINRSFHLDKIIPAENHWQLHFKNNETVEAKAIILAIPASQAVPLVENFVTRELGDRLQSVTYEPAISLMLGFEELNLNFPWQELCLSDHPSFKKIILDGKKRSPQAQTLVLQTNATFTEKYLDADNLQPIAQTLIREIRQLLNLSQPSWHQIHRWRYALPDKTFSESHLYLPLELPLILCGDWCLGNGAEGAIASGLAAATYFDGR
ncbi:fumarate reductase/succinate dehydrogenase flavoprotein domain protein [[Leptolyngbya] sp. PCC 7376]|uniref:NAD(P)/FAD-dependent oxidoreductase n=1 Tax=[Leptolyngbya] sp. PCC 7376 TaxID=111781 RepID=UPI00029F1EEC|nr:FAD-dependent oxidoreductase [[Leptolyngbya] sp. PCC 7376]AFY40388.1 fumarate reductase/succinate dehydrogenase flavoprotein domain protein [[Leptolyngbya] sp. PCC 7376]